MYKIYFKQAIKLLLQNKLMSIIAILGTALAIMMIMSIIVSEEISNVNVAPENNRNQTYYISRQRIKDTVNNNVGTGSLVYETYKKCLTDLKIPRYVSVLNKSRAMVKIKGMEQKFNFRVNNTDADYWNIFSFDFIAGRPFTKEEFESGIKYAVISEETARKLVKDENPLDISILVDNNSYQIIGVIKDVPPVFEMARGNIWIPYTSTKNPRRIVTVIAMLENNSDFPAYVSEIREREKKYAIENIPEIVEFAGPLNHRTYSVDLSPDSNEDLKEKLKIHNRKKAFIFIILLLVPAINLSGFSISRIKKRMSEIGVRKAFGAKRHTILLQVLFENLITSLIGGVIGLICSYIAVFQMRDWLLGIPADGTIPIGTLVSPVVFVSVFAVCLIINLLSAGIPAWKASRVTIIHSIHQNDKQ